MGGANIDWNLANSTAARTLTGQSGGAFSGGVDWDPRNSMLGQAAQGNWGEAGRGAMGGLQNAAGFNAQLLGGLASPAASIAGLVDSASGQPQAAARHKKDELSSEQLGAQQQGERQAGEAQQARAAADARRNAEFLTGQATANQTAADEDAFTAARNASRRARGNTLYQGWG